MAQDPTPPKDFDYLSEIDDGDKDDELEMAALSCGLRDDGGCDMVGTEHCDWSCPFANQAAHNRRREQKPRPAPLLDLLK